MNGAKSIETLYLLWLGLCDACKSVVLSGFFNATANLVDEVLSQHLTAFKTDGFFSSMLYTFDFGE